MIIPNIWENKKCSKPPTSIVLSFDCSFYHCFTHIFFQDSCPPAAELVTIGKVWHSTRHEKLGALALKVAPPASWGLRAKSTGRMYPPLAVQEMENPPIAGVQWYFSTLQTLDPWIFSRVARYQKPKFRPKERRELRRPFKPKRYLRDWNLLNEHSFGQRRKPLKIIQMSTHWKMEDGGVERLFRRPLVPSDPRYSPTAKWATLVSAIPSFHMHCTRFYMVLPFLQGQNLIVDHGHRIPPWHVPDHAIKSGIPNHFFGPNQHSSWPQAILKTPGCGTV